MASTNPTKKINAKMAMFFEELQIRKYTFLSPCTFLDMEMKIEWIV